MDKQLNDEAVNTNEGSLTVYEASYLLLPTMSEEQVPQKVAGIKEALVSVGAEVISSEDPVLIDLAYSMVKVMQTSRAKADEGYFGWVKFEVSGDKIDSIKKFFDNNADVLRYLIIKTVKENTLLNGKMKLKSEDKAKKFDETLDENIEEVVVDGDKVVEEVVA